MRYGRLGFWYRLVVVVVEPFLRLTTTRDWREQDRIPPDGGFILAANHVSYVDPMTLGLYVLDAGRAPKYLAKSSLFEKPLIKHVFIGAKQIPVYRGTADASNALTAAVEAVQAGECVLIYPEGSATRDPDCWPMKARTGVARLALMTGAPVVPVAQWGPQELWRYKEKYPASVPAQEGPDHRRAAGGPLGVRRSADDGRGAARGDRPDHGADHRPAGRAARRAAAGGHLRPEAGRVTRAAVLGAGSWGTAFAQVLVDAGTDTVLWARRPEMAEAINEMHENPDYLPRITLPRIAARDQRRGRGARRRRPRGARGAVADPARQPRRRRRPDPARLGARQPDEGRRARHRQADDRGDPRGRRRPERPRRRDLRAEPGPRDRLA